MTDRLPEQNWSTTKKLIVLFVCCYLFFYIFPFPLSEIPGLNILLDYYSKTQETITLCLGKNVLKLHNLKVIESTGSGDTTFDYVSLITTSLLALIAGFLILVFGRNKKNYQMLFNITVIYARYYVGLTVIGYGIAKLYNGQFPSPGLYSMEKTYGNASPMNLLWTFMGFSKPYTMFSGMAEILGGALLLFRRTTALGCIITIGVMMNVVMLNFCYDVPVKLLSSHLLIFTLFILSPQLKNLLNAFILYKPATFNYAPLHLSKKWMRIGRVVLKTIIILGFIAVSLHEMLDAFKENNNLADLDGIYRAETFTLNKDTLSPSWNDTIRWRKLLIENGYAEIITMADSIKRYQIEIDTTSQLLTLQSFKNTSDEYQLCYKCQSKGMLYVTGLLNNDSISVFLVKKTINDYPLMKRGFHWVNEYPNNQ